MNWIRKEFFKDAVFTLIVSCVLLTFINFLFVYYSPSVLKLLPVRIASSISPCYRTLFHYDGEDISRSNFVFGDSFSEGSGDEFLNSDPAYGIFNKLNYASGSELIFGRGGYGNIGTVVEFTECFPLLSTYTSFPAEMIVDYDVTFVFYEGNDLNNNLIEKDREVSSWKYSVRFFFPLYEYIYREGRRMVDSIFHNDRQALQDLDTQGEKFLPITRSGIEIQEYPQSAAIELTDRELDESIGLLVDSAKSIQNLLSGARSYRFLYLPSVASSYDIEGYLRVQSYKGSEYFETSGELNAQRSLRLREVIGSRMSELGWDFCDVTGQIVSVSDEGQAVHGPRDWKHFNKVGYGIVAQAYDHCFNIIDNE